MRRSAAIAVLALLLVAASARALMPTPRHGLAAVAVDDRVFTISGGPRPGGTFSKTTEVYIPD